jgi:hypothetical protein
MYGTTHGLTHRLTGGPIATRRAAETGAGRATRAPTTTAIGTAASGASGRCSTCSISIERGRAGAGRRM